MSININNLPTKNDINDNDVFLTETIQSEDTKNTTYFVVRQNIENALDIQLNNYVTTHKNNQHKKTFRSTGQTIAGSIKTIQIDMSSYNPSPQYSLELNMSINLYNGGVLTNCMAMLNTELFIKNNIIFVIISNNNEYLEHSDFNNFIYKDVIPEKLLNANAISTHKTTLVNTYVKQDESLGTSYTLPNIQVSNTIASGILTLTIPAYGRVLDYNVKITKKRFS